MSALELIADEREKQVAKGYDAAHDDTHTEREIAHAAVRILSDYADDDNNCVDDDDEPEDWVQDLALKMRRRPPVERLTVAAAMIAAEIERIQRK